MASLIEYMGGSERFIDRLDFFHTSGLADISNEPVFSTVYLYHYVGRPGLSAKRVHTYIPSAFNASNGGLPGNDDSGSMGAFVVFGARRISDLGAVLQGCEYYEPCHGEDGADQDRGVGCGV